MPNTPILIEAKTVYGRVNYYVVSEHAKAVEMLTGKKTVDLRDCRALEMLGLRCVSASRAEIPASEFMS